MTQLQHVTLCIATMGMLMNPTYTEYTIPKWVICIYSMQMLSSMEN